MIICERKQNEVLFTHEHPAALEDKNGKIENLKKVRILWKPETGAEKATLAPVYPQTECIFGLAPEGMTPFEY